MFRSIREGEAYVRIRCKIIKNSRTHTYLIAIRFVCIREMLLVGYHAIEPPTMSSNSLVMAC